MSRYTKILTPPQDGYKYEVLVQLYSTWYGHWRMKLCISDEYEEELRSQCFGVIKSAYDNFNDNDALKFIKRYYDHYMRNR